MHPVLFRFETPGFLTGLFPEVITIYSYGALIALGAIMGYFYTSYSAKKELNISSDHVIDLMIYVIIAAVIGGRFFVFFEKPGYYFGNPANMFKLSSQGFVFYGSLIFAIPTMLLFFKWKKIPTLAMLDIMAFTGLTVHTFGRMGCFAAGCCYGKVHSGFPSIVFDHPNCAAKPLGEPLHPTQLYSVFMLLSIMAILFYLKPRKKFDGQLFLIYLGLYAFGRSIIEIFRGDIARGFVIEEVLSNSQLISILFVAVVAFFYVRLSKRGLKRS
ncbi:MAG: prolipoprotein diacylglyceryl transferase [Bacteroidota bacterium]